MNSPKINQTIMILAVIFLALVVSACSASAKTEKKRSTSKNVKKIELKGEKGKLVIEGSGLKLPKGFPDEFVVPEEVLVFPEEEEDVKKKKTRKRINVMRNNIARKNQPGNTEP